MSYDYVYGYCVITQLILIDINTKLREQSTRHTNDMAPDQIPLKSLVRSCLTSEFYSQPDNIPKTAVHHTRLLISGSTQTMPFCPLLLY